MYIEREGVMIRKPLVWLAQGTVPLNLVGGGGGGTLNGQAIFTAQRVLSTGYKAK